MNSYLQYTNDNNLFTDYNSYQKKYRDEIRESDDVTINIIADLITK